MKILCVLGKHAYGDLARGEGYEHANFLPALAELGHEVHVFDSLDRQTFGGFGELNAAFLARVRDCRPDVILCVLMHYEIWTETLDAVRVTSPAAVINWGTDDSWKYAQFARFVAPHVDLYATTSAEAARRAHEEGLDNVVLTQWAADGSGLASPLPSAECRYGVSFVGTAYGDRRRWIQAIRTCGVEVTCFGHGWPAGPVSTQEMRRIVRESRVSLNFSDSSRQWRGLRISADSQIKARVFEVPGVGGLLLTEPAAGLENFYRPGEEIELFRSSQDAASTISRLLNNPALRDKIANAGHRRTAAEHTYAKRFRPLLDEAVRRRWQRANLTAPPLDACLAHHAAPWWLRGLRTVLVAPATLFFGARRGPRAARRMLFELAWRLAGRHTYSARGWPGRIFFRES